MFRLRLKADKSQVDLEHLTGITFSIWSKIESGARIRPNANIIEAFVRALDLDDETWDELLVLRAGESPEHDQAMADQRKRQQDRVRLRAAKKEGKIPAA